MRPDSSASLFNSLSALQALCTRSLWVGSGEEGYQSRGVGRGNADGGWVFGWGRQERKATDREQTQENYRKDQGYTMGTRLSGLTENVAVAILVSWKTRGKRCYGGHLVAT